LRLSVTIEIRITSIHFILLGLKTRFESAAGATAGTKRPNPYTDYDLNEISLILARFT
jgi:hypothetical protein